MRVGIVGYGAWGGIHASSITSLENHKLVAIACRSEESAARARADYPGAAVTTDYRELVARDDIDAVDVVLPSYLHVEVALAALAAGKHVLLEKPMATTIADGEKLVEAVETPGSPVVSLVHELRISEQWASVHGAIARGEIGSPTYAMLNLFRFPYRGGASNWRYNKEHVGSWVLEEPIHFFDLLLWYFESIGAPTAVTAFINEYESGLSRDFTAIVEFESGAHGVVAQTLSGFEHHQVVEVTGDKGAIRSTWSGAMDRTDKPEFGVSVQRAGESAPSRLPFDAPSGELFEIRDYIGRALDAFADGRSLYSARDELNLIRLCLAAEESARTGRRVALA